MTVVAVLGLSGVGKSTLIQNAAKSRKLVHLSASDLIKAQLAHTSEELRKGAVMDNQALMLAEFAKRVAASGASPVIFDGHNVIDTPNGLLEVPLKVFQIINPAAIAFVEAAPETIRLRREGDKKRVRPERSVAELGRHQELALESAKSIAAELGVPFRTIASDDIQELLSLF